MLLQIAPEQIEKAWDFIAPTLGEALPPIISQNERVLTNILRALLAEEAQAWGVYENEEMFKQESPAILLLTVPQEDIITGTRALLIYAMTALRRTQDFKLWEEELQTLVRYARSVGCARISAYTSIPGLVEQLDKMGWETDYRYVTLRTW